MARRCPTLCLPVGKDDYAAIVADPARFRAWLDQSFRSWPELFPTGFTSTGADSNCSGGRGERCEQQLADGSWEFLKGRAVAGLWQTCLAPEPPAGRAQGV